MTLAVLPAFNSIRSASGVTRGAYELASTLEQARAYAVANNTYVFVGLAERDATDTTKSGIGRLWVALVASKDGTKNFGSNNSNLIPLAKLRHLADLRLADGLPASGSMSRPSVEETYRLANKAAAAEQTFSWPMSGAGAGCSFTKVVQFDPRGTAKIPSSQSSIPNKMEIGLAETKGNTAIASENCAALVVDGVTGSVRIYRP